MTVQPIRHRRPPLLERYWREVGLLLVAVGTGLITGAFIAIVQAVNG